MRKFFALFAVVVCLYSGKAHALFTQCDLEYTVMNVALGVEAGFGGEGVARCRDVTGNSFSIPVDVQMVGAGAKIGVCRAFGSIRAVGVGFALDDLLSAIVKPEIGAMVHRGGSIGIGAKVSPLGFHGEITFSGTQYSGACLGIADVQGLIITAAD